METVETVALALLGACAVFGASEATAAPVLHTRNLGQLVGVRNVSGDGVPYYEFRGLRFAAPPVGPHRFKEPRKARPVSRESVVDATKFGPACVQIKRSPATLAGNEDCLVLNVYTPSISKRKGAALYPVVVYIHGGFFAQGKASANPERIVSRGIVVVTVQYRVGVLGFLSSGDRELPGNFGLLDQQLALKWVQQNIHEFRGDRNRVTLAGSSAGASSVTLHMVAPGSRGLFQQAIAASGVFLNPRGLHSGSPNDVRAVARYVGCSCLLETPVAAILPCLRSADPNKLAEASLEFQGWHEYPFSPFRPVIDHKFIFQDPYKLLKEGNVARVPLLLGTTTAEGNVVVAEFMENKTALAELDRKWLDIAPLLLDYEKSIWTRGDRDFVGSAARRKYLGLAQINNSTVPQLIQMEGDRHLQAGISHFAKTLASARGSPPVYMYQYAYRGEFSGSQTKSHSPVNRGPAHADDTGLIFNGSELLPPPRTQADKNMASSLVDIWESFVKTGVPTTEKYPVWKPVSTSGDHLTLLNITSSNTGDLVTVPEIGYQSFWYRLPFMESGFTDCH